jgi:hypothetical protein
LAKAVSGQLEEESSSLLAAYEEIVGQLIGELTGAGGGREALSFLGRHAKNVANILKVIFSFIENRRPDRGSDIRSFMDSQMDVLWKVKIILQEEVRLFDQTFQSLIGPGAGQMLGEVVDDLESIRQVVEETLPDAIRAAWDDLSAESVLSDRRQTSRRAAVRPIRELSDTWATFGEKLDAVSQLWPERGTA